MKRIRIKIKDRQIVAGREYLAATILFMDDGDYAVEIKKWENSKTLQQLRAVKGVLIPRISDYTGETRQEVEDRLKFDYGQWDYTEVRGERCVKLKSFAAYTKREMQAFITGALEHAEYDCGLIFSLEERKQFHIDHETGELTEISNMG